MPRCVHLHEGGPQCVSEAAAGSDFCEDHLPREAAWDFLDSHPFQRLMVRLVALLLLLILLIPFYRTFKALYLLPLTEAGEPR